MNLQRIFATLFLTSFALCQYSWAVASLNSTTFTGEQVIERYLATQVKDTELAYIRMLNYQTDDPKSPVKKYRFLALTKKNAPGSHSFLIRLVRPKEVEGISLLSLEQKNGHVDRHLYLPATERVTALSANDKSGSFLGSDFTYEDLVQEIPHNFEYKRQTDAFVQGADCFVIRAQSREKSSDDSYAYRDLFIEKNTFHLYKVNYYNQADKITKFLESFDYASKEIKGSTVRPHRAVMTNLEKNSITIFAVVESRLNLTLEDKLFTPETIKNWTSEEVSDLIFDNGFSILSTTTME